MDRDSSGATWRIWTLHAGFVYLSSHAGNFGGLRGGCMASGVTHVLLRFAFKKRCIIYVFNPEAGISLLPWLVQVQTMVR